MPQETKNHRLNFIMTEKTYKRLNDLIVKTGTKNKTDIIRTALQVYEWLIEIHENGGEFYIKRIGDDQPFKVAIFINDPMD